jgi:hypothetical protein
MACDCIKKNCDELLKQLKEKHGNSVEVHGTYDLENEGLLLGPKKSGVASYDTYFIEVTNTKKGKQLRRTTYRQKIIHTYCPYCGVKKD